MMEDVRTSKTFLNFYQTIRRQISLTCILYKRIHIPTLHVLRNQDTDLVSGWWGCLECGVGFGSCKQGRVTTLHPQLPSSDKNFVSTSKTEPREFKNVTCTFSFRINNFVLQIGYWTLWKCYMAYKVRRGCDKEDCRNGYVLTKWKRHNTGLPT